MKNMRFLMISMFIATAMLTVSCSKDEDPKEEKDTTKPQINLQSPANETSFNPGDAIDFSAEFTDNVALGSYKIDIHFNDGHDHKAVAAEGEWSYQQSWTFAPELTNETVSHNEIVIPEEVDGVPILGGEYHFLVYCIDKAGNETFVTHEIIVVEAPDVTAPEINITLHPEMDQVYVRIDTIRISGTVADNKQLSELLVAVMRSSSTEDMVNVTDAFVIVMNANAEVSGQASFDFEASIKVGQTPDNNVPPRDVTWARGNFYVIIKAVDESGNVSFSEHYPIVLS